MHTAEDYNFKKKKAALKHILFQSDMKCNKCLMDYLPTGNAPFICRFSKFRVIAIMESSVNLTL